MIDLSDSSHVESLIITELSLISSALEVSDATHVELLFIPELSLISSAFEVTPSCKFKMK